MCGIFGISVTGNADITPPIYRLAFQDLCLLSERRGKEASGFAVLKDNIITVFKYPFPASQMIKKKVYKDNIGFLKKCNRFDSESFTTIGHSRLVTDGTEKQNINNQPLEKSGIVGVHNGIIVNFKQLQIEYKEERQISSLDSEIILTLLRKFYTEEKCLKDALVKTYTEIFGMASIALLFKDINNLLLATNNGSLYFIKGKDNRSFVFASEYYILSSLIEKKYLNKYFSPCDIRQLKPRSACLINIGTNEIAQLDFDDSFAGDFKNINVCRETFPIIILSEKGDKIVLEKTELNREATFLVPTEFTKHFEKNAERIYALRRCNRCLLPETFPFIQFDGEGVCNYCHHYKRLSFFGRDHLEKIVTPYKRTDSRPDCIIGFSGGRDSSYMLHFAKTVLKMNPIAYSYDWGMLTDLGRRNQSRLCAELGIEHILISADIRKKRKYIKKNVLAWLKRPHLGTIPLFMAGDKQYFYYANKLMKQYNINLILFGENLLETTFFKYGFCGIHPNFNKKKSFSLSMSAKLKMVQFYAKEYLLNPTYLNSSFLDTLGAFASFYYIPHSYINFFNYIKWDEKVISDKLIGEYGWEVSPDTKSTWRIGDGTASFYNYIYYIVAGFSEIDTFRSNQIREGIIDRKEALKLTQKENLPRYASMKWYCDTIGIDFQSTLSRINQIPKLYEELL